MVASTRKGLTACTVSTIPDVMGLFVTINICTIMTASHDVSVALLDPEEFSFPWTLSRPESRRARICQDKTRSRTFFQQTFRDRHKRWSDPTQAYDKDRTAESDPCNTGIWGRNWDPRHGKVRQPPCRGTRRRNQGCGLVWLGCPVNSNRVIVGGYVVRPDSVIVPFKLPSMCILYP